MSDRSIRDGLRNGKRRGNRGDERNGRGRHLNRFDRNLLKKLAEISSVKIWNKINGKESGGGGEEAFNKASRRNVERVKSWNKKKKREREKGERSENTTLKRLKKLLLEFFYLIRNYNWLIIGRVREIGLQYRINWSRWRNASSRENLKASNDVGLQPYRGEIAFNILMFLYVNDSWRKLYLSFIIFTPTIGTTFDEFTKNWRERNARENLRT